MLQNVDFFKTLLNGIKSKFQSQQKQISKHNTRLDDQQAQIEDLKNRKIDAVLYTPQTLTDEQQKQARDNIGADVGGYFEIRVTKSGDTYTVDKTYNEIKVAIESGLTPVCRMKRRAADAILDDVFYYYNWQIVDGRPGANAFTFNNMSTSISRYIAIYNSDIVHYFDTMYNFYTLPTATSKTLGGVKPVAKTDVMTQDVGVDENGKLYTEPAEGGTDRSLGITGAQVGQIAKITAVDTDGKPTAWEAVAMAGDEVWEKIAEIELRTDTAEYVLADFATWRKAKVIMTRSQYISGLNKNVWFKVVGLNSGDTYPCGYLTMAYGYIFWEYSAEVNELFILSSHIETNNRNTADGVRSTGTFTPLKSPVETYKFVLMFADTSVIQAGDKVTVIGVRR